MTSNADGSGASISQASRGPSFFNPFAVELPEKLDFRNPSDWKDWKAMDHSVGPLPDHLGASSL